MQLSSNRGLLIRYFHHFGLSLHYINNSIRKFAAEIKTCGNPVIQGIATKRTTKRTKQQ